MLYDIVTIARKELKEIFIQRGSLRSGLANLLVIIAIAGILFPMQAGREWLTNPIGVASSIWMPLFLSMGLVADAFAGERERHTLETLLASRLTDRAILFGKMAASITYGFGMTITALLLGVITINLKIPGAGFYSMPLFIGSLVFSLLGVIFVTSLGVIVSLHASNVRQAYQRMSLGFIVLWLPLLLGPQVLPVAWQASLAAWIMSINLQQLAVIVAAALLVIDAIMITAAITRFQRSRLILD